MKYGLFGNRGQYRMPYTPEFNTADEARAYFRH